MYIKALMRARYRAQRQGVNLFYDRSQNIHDRASLKTLNNLTLKCRGYSQ